ncbi:unnamed protein product [Dicrocoelium dendriticum]|nr:unnamed protein product [Dicrocoelium dendriticum]
MSFSFLYPCIIQRSFLDTTSNKSCSLKRWFYDSRTEELTCVCTVNDSTTVNGQLLQIGTARAIPSISESKFRALSSVKQGQYEFELKIVTALPPAATVQNLVSAALQNINAHPESVQQMTIEPCRIR